MEQDAHFHEDPDGLRSRWQQEHPQHPTSADPENDEGRDLIGDSEDEPQRLQTRHSMPAHAGVTRSRTWSSSQRRRSFTRRDSLEIEQSDIEGRRRRESEGEVGNLTELAAPAPIDRKFTRRDSLEVQAERAWKNRQLGQSQDESVFLSEVAAPAPVDTEDGRLSGDKEDTGSESPSPHSSPERAEEESPPLSATATSLYTVSYLILFSILGTLARLGVEAITIYPQAPFPSFVLWANVGGSLFMGFLAEDRHLFREEWSMKSKHWFLHRCKSNASDAEVAQKPHNDHSKVKKTIPLFVGLATGFCGSFTSFSSFIRDSFLALANSLASPSATSPFNTTSQFHPRNGGYSFEATVAILIIEIACSLCALHFGAHLALLTDPIMPTLPFKTIRRILDPFAVFLAFGCWLGAVFLSIFPPEDFWRGRVCISLVFAPPGCLLRFYASKKLNARIPSFPLGTFLVNIFGTGILGMCYDLQHARNIGAAPNGGVAACQVLEGVMEGFCGCTTTVSTWVAELTALRRRNAYIYGMASVAIALGLLVAVMGSVRWTSGFGAPICSV
jgi:fluoride exporter